MPRLHARDAGQLSFWELLREAVAPLRVPAPARPTAPDPLLDDVRGGAREREERPGRTDAGASGARHLWPPAGPEVPGTAGADVPGTDDGDPPGSAGTEVPGTEDVITTAPPRTRRERLVRTAAFMARLRALGLTARVHALVLTRNRTVMVSVARGVLRVHEGFTDADDATVTAIVTFVQARDRAARARAQRVITSHPITVRPPRREAVQHPADAPLAARLTALHAELNARHFGGTLQPLAVRVSRRLARRLGHYTLRSAMGGRTGQIVLGARHIRRDGWGEAAHTLLHEMVHQWQDETGRPVDHGVEFRRKCREVGITPSATRRV
ncbi:MAG: SprT-like domain-containing protein [Gemmatimonadaceae bacterium]|jgi:hypothetical protein|nr:SprT-like domain-containing protein [Gemmatimonadaceae bacterium]